ncbi:hypothetical protein F511_25111 [Dorcoceras hygrometricum]|uniref:Uncharacterized protein n=1 Tax=Dorcoceras hygrometricum TaxID=472368 RepID=A0A2Z7AUG6_9LAMI|nr:hypothetical protein F511_25111 [Dorcoceras hygrometricum]
MAPSAPRTRAAAALRMKQIALDNQDRTIRRLRAQLATERRGLAATKKELKETQVALESSHKMREFRATSCWFGKTVEEVERRRFGTSSEGILSNALRQEKPAAGIVKPDCCENSSRFVSQSSVQATIQQVRDLGRIREIDLLPDFVQIAGFVLPDFTPDSYTRLYQISDFGKWAFAK